MVRLKFCELSNIHKNLTLVVENFDAVSSIVTDEYFFSIIDNDTIGEF